MLSSSLYVGAIVNYLNQNGGQAHMGKRRQDDPPHIQGHGSRVGGTSPRHGIVHHQAPGYKHSIVIS